MIRLIKSVRAHRYVISNFVARDLKVKYRGTVFGYLWSLLEPAALTGMYWFLFVVIAQRGEEDFVILLMVGLLPWIFFSSVVTGSTNALRSNAALVRKAQLPREIYVISGAASNLVVLLLSMLAVIPFMFGYRIVPGLTLLLWPVSILMLAMMGLGIGLVASCANVILRDVSYLLGVVLRLFMYLSAVVYPVTMVPQDFRYMFLFNPVALCLSMARGALTNRPISYEIEHVLSAALISIVLFFAGSAIFFRWERKAVKFL